MTIKSLFNDHTTIIFLISYASIVFRDKPIYSTKRRYPNKKNSLSITKMNEAFIKALNHILSKQYKYVLVGDAAYGTDNISRFCEENNFTFIFRMRSNINIISKKIGDIKQINQPGSKELESIIFTAKYVTRTISIVKIIGI